MKTAELELRLREHAARVKEQMAAPFDTETEVLSMKNNSSSAKMKISIIAIAAVFLLGTTAFAAGSIGGWITTSDTVYEELPSRQQYIQDIGYAPILIESFENGYSYQTGSAENNEVSDDSGNMVDSFKSATFIYEKDGDTIYFSQAKPRSAYKPNGEPMDSFDGVDIYYHCYTNKLVPEDYVMTEEDKSAEERGELVFSWGTDKVKIAIVESVQWVEDGINYTLMQIDGSLSPDELCDMAKEAIEK